MSASALLPPQEGLVVSSVSLTPHVVGIAAKVLRRLALCPGCDAPSESVHSRYVRTAADLAWQGRRLVLRVTVRRFRCRNGSCKRAIFCERLPGFLAPHARGTNRLADAHREIGFALGGEAGSRLAKCLALPTSPDTLLRRIRQTPPVVPGPVRVLGVDDFAFRKGHTYGTLLVDHERGCVIDLLPDREAESLAAWLRSHPEVEVVSRDRATAYAQAAREAAPAAQQVADRWHLLGNLREMLERVFQQRVAATKVALSGAPVPTPFEVPVAAAESRDETEPTRRPSPTPRQALYEQVRQLHAEGASLRQIVRTSGLHYRTVERYVRAPTCPDWYPGRTGPSGLDRYAEYIRQRLRAGCRNAAEIHRALERRGYRGAGSVVRQYVRRLRAELDLPPARPSRPLLHGRAHVPSPRRLAVSVIRREADRSDEERGYLEKLHAGDAVLSEAMDLAEAFAVLVRERRAEGLDDWFARAERSAVPGVRSFARGLRQDEAAVRCGLSLDWSNGRVEGHVNRLKAIKRAMFGRAKFDLLRSRVLHAA